MHDPHQPPDDPSSAPESGTVRDDTTGNQTAPPDRRTPDDPDTPADDPSRADEQK